MADGMAALMQPVRLPVVARYLSQLAVMLALLTAVPLVVSVIQAEFAFTLRYAVVVAALLLMGVPGSRLPDQERIRNNEAIVVVVLAFVLVPVIMTFPLTATGLPWLDAFFEATSAVTTTGLSTAGAAEGLTPAFLFGRAWMQWYGGLGIAVLSVALLMGHHAAARRLVEPLENEGFATTARTQARNVLIVYGGLTVAGILLYWLLTGHAFEAVLLILASVSTGGFATGAGSLAAVPEAGAWVVTVFSLVGAVPLVLYYLLFTGRSTELWRDREVRALVLMVLVIALLLVGSFRTLAGMPWVEALRHGVALAVSAQSTTGFSTIDVAALPVFSTLVLCVAMVLGGCSGSTAGGLKLLRVLTIARLLQYFVKRTAMPPHAAYVPRLAGRVLEPVDVERATLVVSLYAVVAVVGWLTFVAYGYAPVSALLEVISALSTVGLSAGITRAELETPLKLVLCAIMLLGRLELLAVVVLLYPRTWIGKRT
jgi:trk system potassium uptake protein